MGGVEDGRNTAGNRRSTQKRAISRRSRIKTIRLAFVGVLFCKRPAGRRVAWGGEGKRGRTRCMAGASSSAAKRNGGKPHTVQ